MGRPASTPEGVARASTRRGPGSPDCASPRPSTIGEPPLGKSATSPILHGSAGHQRTASVSASPRQPSRSLDGTSSCNVVLVGSRGAAVRVVRCGGFVRDDMRRRGSSPRPYQGRSLRARSPTLQRKSRSILARNYLQRAFAPSVLALPLRTDGALKRRAYSTQAGSWKQQPDVVPQTPLGPGQTNPGIGWPVLGSTQAAIEPQSRVCLNTH